MNRGVPLDERYFKWLYRRVGDPREKDPRLSHWELGKKLFNTRFIYFVPNDDNRAMDGIELRDRFLDENPSLIFDKDWIDLDCSMLEMLIALSERANYHSDRGSVRGGSSGWFWIMLNNIKLSQFTDDRITNRALGVIDRILDKVNDRTYGYDGVGGLFPLRMPRENQKNVELWYQLSAYLLENGYVRP